MDSPSDWAVFKHCQTKIKIQMNADDVLNIGHKAEIL